MTTLRKIASAALVAVTLSGAALSTTTSAEARGFRNFGGGLAVGAVGGLLLGSALARPAYAEPVYVEPVYVPRCHNEWRTDYYGNSFKVRVCG